MSVVAPAQAYRKVLVVVKQTAFQMYQQLKARGQAPLALRWAHLADRDAVHRKCVEDVVNLLRANACTTQVLGREELHHQHLADHDLIVTVGGDGTALSASHFVRGNIPLLAINSDPHIPNVKHDESGPSQCSHSVGALCACSSLDMHTVVPQVLFRERTPLARARLLLTVSSTYCDTTLPPALNDVLLAHPSPAAVSRFNVNGTMGCAPSPHIPPSNDSKVKEGHPFEVSSRSSGLWVSTATGSTGAMVAAGGMRMDSVSRSLQWRIRDESQPVDMHAPPSLLDKTPSITSGFVNPDDSLRVRWNSHEGVAYIDGHHVNFDLKLGDELNISTKANPILLF